MPPQFCAIASATVDPRRGDLGSTGHERSVADAIAAPVAVGATKAIVAAVLTSVSVGTGLAPIAMNGAELVGLGFASEVVRLLVEALYNDESRKNAVDRP